MPLSSPDRGVSRDREDIGGLKALGRVSIQA